MTAIKWYSLQFSPGGKLLPKLWLRERRHEASQGRHPYACSSLQFPVLRGHRCWSRLCLLSPRERFPNERRAFLTACWCLTTGNRPRSKSTPREPENYYCQWTSAHLTDARIQKKGSLLLKAPPFVTSHEITELSLKHKQAVNNTI